MPYPTINLLWFTRKEAHKSPKMHDSLFQGDVLLLMQCNDFKMTMKSRTTAEIFSVYSFFSLLVEKKKKKSSLVCIWWLPLSKYLWSDKSACLSPAPQGDAHICHFPVPSGSGRASHSWLQAHSQIRPVNCTPSQGNGVWQQLQHSRHSIWDDCIQLKELSVRVQSIQEMSAAFLAFSPVAKNTCFSCPPPLWPI